MEDFQFFPSSFLLAPYIKHYWILKTVGNSTSIARTVPTGMMSLIFHRGNCLLSLSENKIQPRAFLCGQEKTFSDLKYDGNINMISIVFRPAGVKAFFNLPINRTAGLQLTAGDMEDKELSELEHSITSTEEDHKCILLIERFLLRRLTQLAQHNIIRIETAIRMINSGQTDIAKIADATCLSTKQFNRVFSENIGTSPKEYTRIIRFQRTLNLLEKDPHLSFTSLACDCGYFDQSHMIKDFKTFSGYTPSEYIAECPPHSDYFEN